MIHQRVLAKIARLLPPRLGLPIEAMRHWHALPELRLATELCRPDRGAIDIGANSGIFSWYMARKAAWCVAFEPNPVYTEWLDKGLRSVDVHACGLADREGSAILTVPVVNGIAYAGFGSMSDTQVLSGHPRDAIEVPVRTLDSFALQNVGFIKIDVEGFEESVLAGAIETIGRDRPTLLIEVEERHNRGGLTRIESFLAEFDYGAAEAVAGAENNVIFRPTAGGSQ